LASRSGTGGSGFSTRDSTETHSSFSERLLSPLSRYSSESASLHPLHGIPCRSRVQQPPCQSSHAAASSWASPPAMWPTSYGRWASHTGSQPAGLIEKYRSWAARSIQAGPRSVISRIGVEEQVIAAVANAPSQHGEVTEDEHSSVEATAAVPDDTVRCFMIAGPASDVGEALTRESPQNRF
jgi:hypothetical protein